MPKLPWLEIGLALAAVAMAGLIGWTVYQQGVAHERPKTEAQREEKVGAQASADSLRGTLKIEAGRQTSELNIRVTQDQGHAQIDAAGDDIDAILAGHADSVERLRQ